MTAADIDVSGWTRIEDEPLGKKEKVWLSEPETGTPWLFKYAGTNPGKDGTTYQRGDDWSEKGCELLGIALGVPVARLELAHLRQGVETAHGVISRKVHEAE